MYLRKYAINVKDILLLLRSFLYLLVKTNPQSQSNFICHKDIPW